MRCRICDCDGYFEPYIGLERMYDRREQFAYLMCPGCGCLQIESLPQDLGIYYPKDYYSFSVVSSTRWRNWLKRKWGLNFLGNRNLIGSLVGRWKGPPEYISWLRKTGRRWPRVLDVGSGSGALVSDMRAVGIDAVGVDPYLDFDRLDSAGNVIVYSCELSDLIEAYDLVMFNHSLEHIWDQEKTLMAARALLCPDGIVLVRVPLVDSYAWRTFGVNWVQMDAPRHLYLHTRQSIAILAQRTGFTVVEIVEDSTLFQIWGSELYERGGSLEGRTSPSRSVKALSSKWRRMESKVASLKLAGEGDQAAFYLRPGPHKAPDFEFPKAIRRP